MIEDWILTSVAAHQPIPGKRHAFMQRGSIKLRIPNPHIGDISQSLLARLLREAQITREDWDRL